MCRFGWWEPVGVWMYGGCGGAVAVDAPANQRAFVLRPTDFPVFLVKPSHYWTHIAGPIYFIFRSFLREPGYVRT